MIKRENKSIPKMASELIKELQAAIDQTGDKPVILSDPDTDWLMDITFDGTTKSGKNYLISAFNRGYGSELNLAEQ
jgi:hypothetical protein